MYDLIIIGGGPAGMTAAIYAARKKLNTLVLTENLGGQTLWSSEVDNYLGFQLVSGAELVSKFREHIKRLDEENALFDLEIKEGIEVKKVKKINEGEFEMETGTGEKYGARAVIVASGKIPRKLGVPGEDKFLGRGLTYCATCDAPLFRGKDVAVIGGGNSALDAVIQLIKIANKIYLININPKLGGDEIMREKVLEAKDKVEILNTHETMEVRGENTVTGLVVRNIGNEQVRELSLRGVFVEIGSVPSISFIKELVKLNEWGEIIIDPGTNATSESGIFAAGDVTEVREKQIVIAAGEGAKAALAAYEYLVKLR
ncbi:MAG: NAD(P)/FAD-dependent oxidoreductase [Patescibacteria group bacterium]